MKQLSFAANEFVKKPKQTKREKFLRDQGMPQQVALVAKGVDADPLIPTEILERIVGIE